MNRSRSLWAETLLLWFWLRDDGWRYRFLLQRMFENFVQRMHVGDFDITENVRREIRHHIRLVVRRQQHFLDARPLRSEHFFLYAADRQNHARKRHFAGHRKPVLHWAPAQQAHQRGDHCRPGRRAVLRHCARRHVDVNVLLAEEVRIDAVALAVRSRPGQCRSHRFLHDFSQMAGHGELLAATHTRRFDEDDVASHRCPDQSDGNAGTLDTLLDFLFRAEFRHAQEFADHFRCTTIFSILPSAMRRACLRVIVAISRSRLRTPASRVKLWMISCKPSFVNSICSPTVRPCSLACLGIRYLCAMCSFSSPVYPGNAMISMRSRNGSGMGSIQFAVAMNSTFERSNGTSR